MEALEPVEAQRARCEGLRDAVGELARIHLDIDAPRRRIGSDEPDWVFHLRKVCLHAMAITKCEVDVDGLHAMTAELRAAYGQMDAVWRCLPDGLRFEADRDWWRTEARDGLAAFNHPTPSRLMLGLSDGGFDDTEEPWSYARVAIWLGRLGCGYGMALGRLAQVLGTGGDVDARLESVLRKSARWVPGANGP